MTVRDWLEREMDTSVPPWTTARFWLAAVAVVISVIAIALASHG